jgi:hypothetical protein
MNSDMINKAKAAMLRDKKKTGLMLGLLAVGLLMWGRLMLKEVPRTASATGETVAAAPEKVEVSNSDRPTVSLVQPGVLERNLFRLDPSRYSRTDNEEERTVTQKLPQGVSDEAVRRDVIAAARGLRLQSVTLGDVPAAIINRRLIRVGQSIEGFTLLHVDERSAVLRKQDFKVRIGM